MVPSIPNSLTHGHAHTNTHMHILTHVFTRTCMRQYSAFLLCVLVAIIYYRHLSPFGLSSFEAAEGTLFLHTDHLTLIWYLTHWHTQAEHSKASDVWAELYHGFHQGKSFVLGQEILRGNLISWIYTGPKWWWQPACTQPNFTTLDSHMYPNTHTTYSKFFATELGAFLKIET